MERWFGAKLSEARKSEAKRYKTLFEARSLKREQRFPSQNAHIEAVDSTAYPIITTVATLLLAAGIRDIPAAVDIIISVGTILTLAAVANVGRRFWQYRNVRRQYSAPAVVSSKPKVK